jgi:hypothetical protein
MEAVSQDAAAHYVENAWSVQNLSHQIILLSKTVQEWTVFLDCGRFGVGCVSQTVENA